MTGVCEYGHCVCSKGIGGPACDIKLQDITSCGDSGALQCYNGGICKDINIESILSCVSFGHQYITRVSEHDMEFG